jgi:predicted O-methyltransferase YrrM
LSQRFVSNKRICARPLSFAGRVHRKVHIRAAEYLFNKQRKISEKPIESLLPIDRNYHVILPAAFGNARKLGNPSLFEQTVLGAVARYLSPPMMFEFGTYDGATTLLLALNTPESTVIRSIDLPANDPIRALDNDDTFYTGGVLLGEAFLQRPEKKRIIQIFENTMLFDCAELRQKMGFIFVDAGHTYDCVKNDSEKALEMLGESGVIFWHDYTFGHPGVYIFLNELAAKIPLVQIGGTTLVCYLKGQLSRRA